MTLAWAIMQPNAAGVLHGVQAVSAAIWAAKTTLLPQANSGQCEGKTAVRIPMTENRASTGGSRARTGSQSGR